jgi:hypothetical protein
MINTTQRSFYLSKRFDELSQTRSPIIIIGMHRSGTSLLSRICMAMNVHMGVEQDKHYESIFFQTANDKMLHSAGGSWLNPHFFIQKIRDPRFMDTMALLAREEIESQAGSFGPINSGQLWGWKDPRSTLTLPVWLRIFPNARVIHIIRNGVGVALSLKKRTWRNYLSRSYNDIERIFPVGSFVKGYNLWNTYLLCIERYSDNLANFYELRYEDLLKKPEIEISALADEIDVSITEKMLNDIKELVKSPRPASWYERFWVKLLFQLGIVDKSLLLRRGYSLRI